MTNEEILLMSQFSCQKQKEIVDTVIGKLNTSNKQGLQAAMSDVVWRGFVSGMEAVSQLKEKQNG